PTLVGSAGAAAQRVLRPGQPQILGVEVHRGQLADLVLRAGDAGDEPEARRDGLLRGREAGFHLQESGRLGGLAVADLVPLGPVGGRAIAGVVGGSSGSIHGDHATPVRIRNEAHLTIVAGQRGWAENPGSSGPGGPGAESPGSPAEPWPGPGPDPGTRPRDQTR